MCPPGNKLNCMHWKKSYLTNDSLIMDGSWENNRFYHLFEEWASFLLGIETSSYLYSYYKANIGLFFLDTRTTNDMNLFSCYYLDFLINTIMYLTVPDIVWISFWWHYYTQCFYGSNIIIWFLIGYSGIKSQIMYINILNQNYYG